MREGRARGGEKFCVNQRRVWNWREQQWTTQLYRRSNIILVFVSVKSLCARTSVNKQRSGCKKLQKVFETLLFSGNNSDGIAWRTHARV